MLSQLVKIVQYLVGCVGGDISNLCNAIHYKSWCSQL